MVSNDKVVFLPEMILTACTQSSELPMTKERSQGIALGCRAILQYSLHKASAIESSHFSKVRKNVDTSDSF